jgi:hypothetical protein
MLEHGVSADKGCGDSREVGERIHALRVVLLRLISTVSMTSFACVGSLPYKCRNFVHISRAWSTE